MKLVVVLAVLGLVFSSGVSAADGDTEARVKASRAAVKAFFGDLKGELVQALKSGGPVKAVEVCNGAAPQVTMNASERAGWRIARTSLKLRNPNNRPDAWEIAVLDSFEARRKAGEDITKMEYWDVVTVDGGPAFRYMKAIPTDEKPCLACHGSKIKPGIDKVLDEYYPDDKARGYKAGEIRGAFTITQPM